MVQRPVIVTGAVLAVWVLASPGSSAATPRPSRAAPTDSRQKPAVTATTIRKAFPLVPVEGGRSEPAPTEAVVLENAHLRATVVPAQGGRVAHLVHKGTGRDVLAGGAGFRFPHPSAWPPPDDAGVAWRVVKGSDGSVTVAMDRRFRQFTGPRRAHFSPLRLGIHVRLRPGSTALEVTGRVDNRLPLRQGFRLWHAARFPSETGAGVLLSAASVADAALRGRQRWPGPGPVPVERLGERPGGLCAVGPRGDGAGVYYAGADANVLVICPRYVAPGAHLAARAGAVEVALGSDPTPAFPGRYLQPFGMYEMPVRLAVVTGVGPVVWADEHLAVAWGGRRGAVGARVVSFEPMAKARLVLRTDDGRREVAGPLGPACPLVARSPGGADRVRVTVLDAEGDERVRLDLPLDRQPIPEETLKTLRGPMEPWDWAAMEVAGWHPPEGRAGLTAAMEELTRATGTDPPDRLLAAARVLMLASEPGTVRWQGVRGRLAFSLDRSPRPRYSHAYLATMLTLESGGRPTPVAAEHYAGGYPLPAAHYMAAIEGLASGAMMPALRHLRACTMLAPPLAMGFGEQAIAGNERLHPSARAGGQWPRLMRAAVRIEIKDTDRAIRLLERLLREDPARPEALALLAEAHKRLVKGYTPASLRHRDKAKALEDAVSRLFAASPQAKRDFDALLAETRLGRWTGIPRP